MRAKNTFAPPQPLVENKTPFALVPVPVRDLRDTSYVQHAWDSCRKKLERFEWPGQQIHLQQQVLKAKEKTSLCLSFRVLICKLKLTLVGRIEGPQLVIAFPRFVLKY